MENVPSVTDLTQYINPEIHNSHPAFAQTLADQKENPRPDTYKTVMCMQWLGSSFCAFGPDCKFAHGEAELRPAKLPIKNSMKYKTKLCDKYTTTGLCPFGNRCLFIHPDQRSSAYFRQTVIAQKLLQQSLGVSFQPSTSRVSSTSSRPISATSSSPYITPTSSLAPSPPKSYHSHNPLPSRPHPSWPLMNDNDSIFIDDPFHKNESLNHSRSLPNSVPPSRRQSSNISPYSLSHETHGSTSGAWTLF
jgi:hypothetical protein